MSKTIQKITNEIKEEIQQCIGISISPHLAKYITTRLRMIDAIENKKETLIDEERDY